MLARFSVKKPYTVIVAIILVIALGVISFLNMTTDLLPSMDLPYVIVYTVDTGSTPESIETDVTRPLESAFSTLTNIKNVTSTSSENLSLIILEFTSDADMNTAMIEISSEIDQVSGGWDDSVGTPVVMKLNPDMLPVTIAAVNMGDAGLLELSDFVEDTLLSEFEAIDGVASVNASGIMTQQVDITIEQSRIDTLNSAILREVDSKLADTEQKLLDGRRQINSGKNMLADMRVSTLAKIDEALAAIDNGEQQLPYSIAALNAQRAQLVPQLEAARAAAAQLDGIINMSDEEKAAAMQIGTVLSELEAQRKELQKELDSVDPAVPNALREKLSALQAQRDTVAGLRDEEIAHVSSLQLLDKDTLEKTIRDLQASIKRDNETLADIRGQLEDAITERDQAARDLSDLDRRIAALQPDPTKIPATDAPTHTPAAENAETVENTEIPNADDTPAADENGTPAPAETKSEPVETQEKETPAPADPKPEKESESEEKPVKQEPVKETPAGQETAFRISLMPVAYAEGESLEELIAERALVAARLEKAQIESDALTEQYDALRDTLTEEQTALDEALISLDNLEEGNIAIQNKIDEANKRIAEYDSQINALDAEIEAVTAELSAGTGALDTLTASIAALDAQITAVRESDAYKLYVLLNDPKALKEQHAQAADAVTQLENAITNIDTMLAKLNEGIIPGGMIEGMDEDTKLSDARAQLIEARAAAVDGFAQASDALSQASKKISEAWKEFSDARDEALENAGIDGIITVNLISQILGAQNFDMPAGYVSDADGRYLVSVGNKFASITELKQTKLFSLGLDTVDDVRLLDVASVSISDNSEDLFTLLNGHNGVMLSFEKQSTASTAEVAKLITAKSEKLMEKYPGLEIKELMNQGDYINLIVDSVLQNLLYGGGLAILVLLLFLLDWRPTLIVAISIPTSVVVAFVGMYFCGITLNVMSLSGLALGVGMLVDNSIVSIENIYRLRNEEKLPVLTACIKGVKQVGGALIASTLTTVCIFLPIVFITGTARDLFSDMGLSFAFSLLASLLVAMTVVPSFSASLFRNSKMKEHRIFEHIQNLYTVLLRGALKVKLPVLLLAVGLLVFAVKQVPDMPMSLMPSVNSSQMQASLSFAEEADMKDEEKQSIAIGIMDKIMEVPGVTDVGLTGSSSLSMMSSMRGGGDSYSYYILVEEGTRPNSEIAADMNAAVSAFTADENVILNIKESTMDMSAMTGSGININIYGNSIPVMRQAAEEIAALCAQLEGAENIDDGSSKSEPKLAIIVDKELASDNGLTVAQVYQYIAQRLYGGVKLTEAELDGREYTLYVYTDKNMDLKPADLAGMEIEVVGTDSTKHVLISDIATINDGVSLETIRRSNQKRTISVSFDIAKGYSANLVNKDLTVLLDGYTPPAGCSVKLSGENENLMEYMIDLVEMLAIAILFILLIMVAQFQSFKSPIIVMFTIPLAFTGGLLALQLTGMDLSIISMVGFLMLAGVVVNNGIVFIDCVNQLRIGGMSKREALIETGRIRLRPILMSVLTTVLGMLTMALGNGLGAEMMQPMAIVTIGGLAYSTLMTLFVIPALYDIFNGEKMKAREIEMIKEASGMKREDFEKEATF